MIGTTVSRYRILSKLGGGGMGVVYEAEDLELGRRVAVKFLPEETAKSADALERFKREARAASALNHPHICTIHDVGVHDGQPFLVMERLSGTTLKHVIGARALPVDQLLSLGEQIAAALDAAHRAGIVHRDLKPANLFVNQGGDAKVLDFGLAKFTASGASGSAVDPETPTGTGEYQTEAGTTLGTVAYMSPEQARGQVVDARSDLFSLGVVLYEMATGRLPFEGSNTAEIFAAILRNDPVPPRELVPDQSPALPARLEEIILKALEKDASLRYQSAADLRGDLRRLRRDTSGGGMESARSARNASVPTDRDEKLSLRGKTFSGTLRGVWVGLGAAALVAVAGIGYFALRGGELASTRTKAGGAGSPAVEAAVERSIAVLPFVNGSGDADDEYLADGITDELIAGLGKVPGLHVAARSSAFAFKGLKTEVREIARRLGVETVLEGTVRRSGKRLRVTASLVSAVDGLQIWSSTFQNEGGDTFAVQDEVTRGVVSGLALQLGGAALAASQAGRTADPEAHDLYLRGLALMRGISEAELRQALDFYQQALARDPSFALAYAGIGWVYLALADAYLAPNEAYPKARTAAQAALGRDELVADAHAVLGYALSTFYWDPEAGQRELRRAVELDPNSALSFFVFGFERCLAGRFDEGLAHLARSERLDPLSPLAPFSREMCFYVAHRFDEAIVAHRKTMEIDPKLYYLESFVGAAHRELGDFEGALLEYREAEVNSGGDPQYGLAITYARMGRTTEAREIARRLDDLARTRYVPYWKLAAVRGSLGDMDEAVALLQRAFDTRESWMVAARLLPEVAALATKDQRAQLLLDQVDALLRSAGGESTGAVDPR